MSLIYIIHSVPLQITTAMVCGALGMYFSMRLRQKIANYIQDRAISFSQDFDDLKMVILVRNDINMTKGKAAAQCCHAVLELYKSALKKYPDIVQSWEQSGQPKVTLKIESEQELNEVVKKARASGLCAESIRDAGRTQLASGTKTVAAIGPGPIKLMDTITGHLKLY